MIGINMAGEPAEKIAGSYRNGATARRPAKRLCARRAKSRDALLIRRDLAIGYLRINQKWSIEDIAEIFMMSRFKIMRIVDEVKNWEQFENAARV